MKTIILIGYMGAGKTTVGHQLAASLGVSFYDLDWYIQMRFHRTVEQLFEERGEEGFREIERNMLHEVAEFEDVIIACGGGTPCYFDNIEYMNEKGTTVFLNASLEALMRRLSTAKAKSKRPIIADKNNDELAQFITEALEKRMPYYSKAKLNFDSSYLEDGVQIHDSVESLSKMLKEE